jgi:hypothetical protein
LLALAPLGRLAPPSGAVFALRGTTAARRPPRAPDSAAALAPKGPACSLRLEIAESLPPSVLVQVGERRYRVRPLVDLAASDDDVADVLRRAGL